MEVTAITLWQRFDQYYPMTSQVTRATSQGDVLVPDALGVMYISNTQVLTLEIGLRSIFRSLISSSKNQTNTLAAKKYWKKIFAPLISPQVEPFPHNKHPIEHGSAFLIAYSCAIGQLQ